MSDIVKILTNIQTLAGLEISAEAAFRYRELLHAPDTDKQAIAELLTQKKTTTNRTIKEAQ